MKSLLEVLMSGKFFDLGETRRRAASGKRVGAWGDKTRCRHNRASRVIFRLSPTQKKKDRRAQKAARRLNRRA